MPRQPEMTEEKAKELHQRAIIHARSLGFSEHAEELAQDVMLQYLSGKGQHQKIDFAVIDAIRRRFGHARLDRNDSSKWQFRNNMRPLKDKYQAPQTEDIPGKIDFDRMRRVLKDTDLAVVTLRYIWGFTNKEIGDCFGFCETWAALRMTYISEKIKKYFPQEDKNGQSK